MSTPPGSPLAPTAEVRSEPPLATLFCGPGTWCDETPVAGVPALLVSPIAAALPSPAAASTTTAYTTSRPRRRGRAPSTPATSGASEVAPGDSCPPALTSSGSPSGAGPAPLPVSSSCILIAFGRPLSSLSFPVAGGFLRTSSDFSQEGLGSIGHDHAAYRATGPW